MLMYMLIVDLHLYVRSGMIFTIHDVVKAILYDISL